MRMNYIAKIQANLKRYQVVNSRRTTSSVLDGSYKSVFKGRSLNFDELREYVPGDEIKDVDWKASARTRKLYVREYVAEKKHNVMFVFDSNARMLADSEGLEEKRELAIMSAGTLAYFVERNGDFVGATFADRDMISHFPLKSGLANIELILENYHRSVSKDNHSDINVSLDYIVKQYRRKMVLIIVTDTEGVLKLSPVNLKRLLVAHDVLLVNISDADFSNNKLFNIQDSTYLPDFFTKDKELEKRAKSNKSTAVNSMNDKLKKYGIPCVTVDYLKELDFELLNLLDRHKSEKH